MALKPLSRRYFDSVWNCDRSSVIAGAMAAMGMRSFRPSTSAALGPAVGGWARDTYGGFVGLFLVCAATAGIMLMATWFMKPPVHRRLREPTGLQGEAA
jgi:cyanate permease